MSLAGDDSWGDPDSGERFLREPLLERVNAAAQSALTRVTRVRYGALAVCAVILLLVVLLLASRLTAHSGDPAVRSSAGAAQLHREQARVARLSAELRSSQQKLQTAQPQTTEPRTAHAPAAVPAHAHAAAPAGHVPAPAAVPARHAAVPRHHGAVPGRHHPRSRAAGRRHSRRGGQ